MARVCIPISSLNVELPNGVIDLFKAIEVRYNIEWPKSEVVVIPDDTPVNAAVVKPTQASSTNTFAVPEDDDESETGSCDLDLVYPSHEDHVDFPSDDTKESVARSWESVVLQPAETSSVSSVGHSETPESSSASKPSNQPFAADTGFPPSDQLSFGIPSSAGLKVLDPVKPQPYIQNPIPSPLLNKTSSASKPLTLGARLPSSGQLDKFANPYYQEVPEPAFSKWSMMKPMFMRLADMAWGESNEIPDVDYENCIIHAAKRCSFSKDSYSIDDSRPCVGTEIIWKPDWNDSDTSFHRLPGASLKYWSVDKRRYWIIHEHEDDTEISNCVWVVEKPWGILSDATKEELRNELEIDDSHKCWIVRTWEPQFIGNSWREMSPYWDSSFQQELPSDDESIYSYDVECGSEDDEAGSDGLAGDLFGSDDASNLHRHGSFRSEEGSDIENSSANSELDSSSIDGEETGLNDEDGDDSSSGCSWYPDASDSESESEYSESSDDVEIFMEQAEASPFGNYLQDETANLDQRMLENSISDSCASPLLPPWRINNFHSLTNPDAQFPAQTISRELPTSCVVEVPAPNPGPPAHHVYQDGPFSTNTNSTTMGRPLPLSPAATGGLKRTASDMESCSVVPDSGFSQDAQRLPLDTASLSDLETILSETKNDVDPVVAENIAVIQNDRPAKRVKSDHTPSKSLASHVTTAIVGALLGGLGTIAMLAALPNEYFA